jgi:hypothetical protein
MQRSREHVDEYAETHVLLPQRGATPAVPGDSDALALYEEYAREVARDATAQPKKAPARGKR